MSKINANKLFTVQELSNLGFKWIYDGGYYYMMLDNEDPKKIVVTADVDTEDEDAIFKAYLLGDVNYTTPLSRGEIVRLKHKGRASRFGRAGS